MEMWPRAPFRSLPSWISPDHREFQIKQRVRNIAFEIGRKKLEKSFAK
jgi:hypothetical protein